MKRHSKHENQSAGYKKEDQFSQGLAITHEQATDTLTEGTIDGQIDQVDEEGKLLSHEGEDLTRVAQRYGKKK
ncbi:YozQ family protein [Thalassobacillus devorans]|uniref:YozQ family protein n=1 Tax=Thalassobacillus devorans TaxID=279813 RepID=UPI0004BBA3F0|nr:YozQ family protein [Thalassobacillus devorans]